MSTNYTQQQLDFVQYYLEESKNTVDYIAAAKIARSKAGYADNVPLSPLLNSVKDLIIESMKTQLITMLPKLVNKMEKVVDNPAEPGAKTVVAAISTMMDRAGLIKPDESTLNIKAPNGVIILPQKQSIE